MLDALKLLIEASANTLRKQGFVIVLLLTGIYYFYERMQVLEKSVEECKAAQINLLTNIVVTNNEIIKQNNELLMYIKFHIQTIKEDGSN